jgi:hypothetical protein
MSTRPAVLLTLCLASAGVAQTAPPAAPVHDRAFWQHLVDDDGKLPQGESAAALLRELSPFLGSPDPTLRDTFAYSLSEAWIYRDQKLTPADLRERLAEWQGNLKSGLGEQGTDSVLRRSFSALELSLLAAYDLKASFLTQTEYDTLLGAALDYLAAERDVRGYDAEKGWMHSVAHTADLLKFLARSPHLAPAGQARILSAIAAKLEATGPLVHGEDERLARAVLSLVRRPDFDATAFRAWHAAYPARQKALWSAARLDPAGYAALGNAKHLLVSLYALLAQVKEPAPALVAARDELLGTLGAL